jgi:hypothetical protein
VKPMGMPKIFLLVVAGSLIAGVLVFGFMDFGIKAFAEPVIPPEAETLVVTALEDNSWLTLTTEQEFRTYCQAIYSERMIEPMVASFVFFVAENDDWHTETNVTDLKVLSAHNGTIEFLVKVEYVEIDFSPDNLPQDYVSGQDELLVSVIKENDTFKIDSLVRMEAE